MVLHQSEQTRIIKTRFGQLSQIGCQVLQFKHIQSIQSIRDSSSCGILPDDSLTVASTCIVARPEAILEHLL